MSKTERATLTTLLLGDVAWPKPLHHGEPVHVAADEEIVYEDDHVVAYMEREDDPQENARAAEELRVTLTPKRHIATLLDLGLEDDRLSIAILNGIQQVGYRLGLLEKGFEVRAHVLPPLQQRPQLTFKIRAGKPPQTGDEGAG